MVLIRYDYAMNEVKPLLTKKDKYLLKNGSLHLVKTKNSDQERRELIKNDPGSKRICLDSLGYDIAACICPLHDLCKEYQISDQKDYY